MINSKSRSENSVRNTVVGIFNKSVTLLLSFSARTIFIHLLGVEYLGVNALFGNILMVLSLADLGISNVMNYSFYKPILEKDEKEICSLLNYFRKLSRRITISILLIGIGFLAFLDKIIISELPYNNIILYYLLYLLNLVLSYYAIYKSSLINADQKIYIVNFYNTIFIIIQNVVQIIFLLFTRNYFVFLMIQSACTLINNVCISNRADKLYPFIHDKINLIPINIQGIKTNLKSMFLCKVCTVMMNNTDNILISVIIGTIYAGYYSNYSLFIININTFIYIIVQAVLSSLGNLNASGDMEKSNKVFYSLVLLFHWLSAFCSLCFLLVFNDFITIWIGEKYLLNTGIVVAIVVNFYIQNIVNPVWMFRESMGLFREMIFAMLISSVINILLSFLLGKYFGLIGIILSTAFARIFTTLWYEPLVLFKYKFHKKVKRYYFIQMKYAFTTGVAMVITFLFCRYIPVSLSYILLKIVISFFIVSTAFLVTNYRNEDFTMLYHYLLGLTSKNKQLRGEIN